MNKSIIKSLLIMQACFFGVNADDINEKEAQDIAIESYIYGYPLITMDLTQDVMTNVKKAEGLHAPMGQFINAREFPDPSFNTVTAPNADTLYSVAWLDLSWEPYVLHLPDLGKRYYLMPLLSGWTDVFAPLGTRTTGNGPQDYLITGPDWKGAIPTNLKPIKSPTDIVWLLGRTYSTGTKEDYELVHKIQDQYSLVPLSEYKKDFKAIQGTVDPDIDMKTAVRDQVNKLDATSYFNKLGDLMKNNPPAQADKPLIDRMAKIGLVPGDKFNPPSNIAKALENVPKLAQEKIMAHQAEAGTNINGWTFSTKTGAYGTDYLQRAYVAAIGLGANLPEDAIYPTTTKDFQGNPLSGKNNYVIHFAKNETPPVNGFWSLTMYNDKYFFVENPLNRYSISPRNNFKYNDDGSLDLYIQNQSPGKDKESNWLPAPNDAFILMFRFYWPKEALLQQNWKVPPVKQQ